MPTKCEIKEGKDHEPEIPFPKWMIDHSGARFWFTEHGKCQVVSTVCQTIKSRGTVDVFMCFFTDIPIGTIIECQNTLGD